jgi:hypothetical protein
MSLRSREKQNTKTQEITVVDKISNARRESNHEKNKRNAVELNDSKEKRNCSKAEVKNEGSRNTKVMNTSLIESDDEEMTNINVKSKVISEQKYSSSEKDSDDNFPKTNKVGRISCVCLYNTWDPEIMRCGTCGNFSHTACYGGNVEKDHTCVHCALTMGVNCGNKEIQEHYDVADRKERTHSDKQKFVFKQNMKRVLKSILNQEHVTCHPDKVPNIEYLKIRFGFSTSYASKISLHMINEGLIKFYGGFSFDASKIITILGIVEDELDSDEIERENRERQFEFGACYNDGQSGSKQGRSSQKQTEKRAQNLDKVMCSVKETSTSTGKLDKKGKGPGKGKKSKPLTAGVEATPEVISDSSSTTPARTTSRKRNRESSQPGIQKLYETPQKVQELGNQTDDKGNESPSSFFTGTEIYTDREGCSYKNKLVWPLKYTNSEARSSSQNHEPVSVAELGKHTKGPVFGQIINKREAKQNNDNEMWNFHCIVGMGGELVQMWSFGTQKEIQEIDASIIEDEYYFFGGDYSIREKYSTRFKHTNDWAIYLSSKCRKFDRIKKSRKYVTEEGSKSEEREVFAEKFKPATKKGKKVGRKTEHTAKLKKKELDPGQRKITEFGRTDRIPSESSSSYSERNTTEGEEYTKDSRTEESTYNSE